MRNAIVVLQVFVAYSSALQAQAITTPSPKKLAFLVTSLVEDSIQAAPPGLQGLLRQSISVSQASVNSALAAQLSNLPIPSPASAYRFTFDPNLGVYVRSVQSLGPILTERAETIGRNQFHFALTYQRYSFNGLDDLDLRRFEIGIPLSVPASVFNPALRGEINGLIAAQSSIDITISQATAHVTYGLTHNTDISLAMPIVHSSVTLRTEAAFLNNLGQPLFAFPARWLDGASTGLGDGVVRIKRRLFRSPKLGVALATDFRLPIGDEFNYHGAGAYGVKPFLVLSASGRRISPRVNAGYQWNGSSFLASNSATRKQKLPTQVFYSAGCEAGVSEKLTLAFDFFDTFVANGERSFLRDLPPHAAGQFQSVVYENRSRHEYSASAGVKAALPRGMILSWNVLFCLNSAGLRARVVPMLGASVVF